LAKELGACFTEEEVKDKRWWNLEGDFSFFTN
jgi:hypothetical protein